MSISSVCVYCASSTGSNPKIIAATDRLGALLAERGIELVYGGGAVGLMGRIANAVLSGGGTVTGVMPAGLFPTEVSHGGLTHFVEVATMHERKAEMIRRSDAFIALPGGFGTMEELAEATTWLQIGLHAKPVGLLNVDGFWDHFLAWIDRAVTDALLKESNRSLLLSDPDPVTLLRLLQTAPRSVEPKWIDENFL
ncbi:MAG: TIGR00730 family Rossman fold protein [Acidimicrobiales bacterium]